jgi:hypothetical protein
MKILKPQIEIGSRVRLLEDVEMFECVYTKGHEFTVYGASYRGWDLIDDDGNKIDECLFIHDKLELLMEKCYYCNGDGQVIQDYEHGEISKCTVCNGTGKKI